MKNLQYSKGSIVHLLLAISSSLFFLINRNVNIENKSFLIQLWGFSIWIYLIVAFIQAMNVIAMKQISTQKVFFVINMFSQVGILIGFSCVYVAEESSSALQYESLGILCYFIVLIIVEMITSFLYKGQYDKYVLKDGNLDSGVIQNYIYNKIIRSIKITSVQKYLREEDGTITEKEKERIEVSVKNCFSLVFIVLISFIIEAFVSLVDNLVSAYLLASILMIGYIYYNRKKYELAKITKKRFFLDMSGTILSVFCYAFLELYSKIHGFASILLAIYFLTPFIMSFYDLLNTYQLGKCVKVD